MAIKFCADEILEVAVDIEKNGREFYSKAANVVEDKNAKELLGKLAAWEIKHEEIFTAMRKDLGGRLQDDTVMDPNCEEAMYLQALADGKIFNPKMTGEEILGGDTEVMPILEKALAREKDAVIFYTAMKELVPAGDRAAVEKIIREEMSHVRFISVEIDRLKTI